MKFKKGQQVRLHDIGYMAAVRRHFNDPSLDHSSVFVVESTTSTSVMITYKGKIPGGISHSDLRLASAIRRL